MIGCYGSIICFSIEDPTCRECKHNRTCRKEVQTRLQKLRKELDVSVYEKRIQPDPVPSYVIQAKQLADKLIQSKIDSNFLTRCLNSNKNPFSPEKHQLLHMGFNELLNHKMLDVKKITKELFTRNPDKNKLITYHEQSLMIALVFLNVELVTKQSNSIFEVRNVPNN